MVGRGGGFVDIAMEVGKEFRRRLPRGLRLAAPLGGLAAGIALIAAAVISAGPGVKKAEAIASCIQHSNTGEEQQFMGLLQQWRNSHIAGSYPLTVSAPLNAAAYGFAVFMVNNPDTWGATHYADGSNWSARAVQCGYPQSIAAGGEGIAGTQASSVINMTAQQALDSMAQGGGIFVPSDVGAPVKCVGTGKAVSADGKKVFWVTLLFATFDSCPQAVVSQPGASPSPSPTSTGTATATPTKTPTPTPSPTPQPRFGVSITFAPNGWVLVTLPAGQMADVLARARGCYLAVYQLDGEQWLRYAPDVPAYARNLTASNGGAFWILGSSQDCGSVSL